MKPNPRFTTPFRRAAIYGTLAMMDSRAGAFYRALAGPRLSAFEIAASDYLRPPAIDEIALGLYDGLAGDEIIITANDDVEVAAVHVVIRDLGGRILESGPAENRADDAWAYTAQRHVPIGEPLTIEVTARDRPRNATIRTAPWVPKAELQIPNSELKTDAWHPSANACDPTCRNLINVATSVSD